MYKAFTVAWLFAAWAPPTYVPNIFFTKPDDYRAETVSVMHDANAQSAVWLPVQDRK